MDIFYEAVKMFWVGIEEQINSSSISDNIFVQFKNNRQIKREKNRKKILSVDEVVSVISFIFDMNFKESFEILEEEDYINRILDRFGFNDEKTKTDIEKIRDIANKYVKNNI